VYLCVFMLVEECVLEDKHIDHIDLQGVCVSVCLRVIVCAVCVCVYMLGLQLRTHYNPSIYTHSAYT
jgi:hypothetical protein